MRLLYNFFIYLYFIGIRIAALFNKKAKNWVKGRVGIYEELKVALPDKHPVIWFHCASLGEFEQGRPVIEQIRTERPDIQLVLTFFSPSGYEIRKNYTGVDHVFYLPLDTPSNAKKMVEILKPVAVFFVKYEFWFNYLNELKQRSVPTYLVSGIFRADHYFFKAYASWFRVQLKAFTHFYLQDEISLKLLQSIGYNNLTLSGDTRFDRVYDVSKNVKSIPLIEQFKQQHPVFIAGSTWEPDETLLASFDFFSAGFKLIIAPHEISAEGIRSLSSKFKASICYSNATADTVKTANVLIIDNIGMLSALYQYGDIAYIGGGFGKGIHNILEAAAFGLPVIFGPNHEKFTEAKELIRLRAAFVIHNKEELRETFRSLTQSLVGEHAAVAAKKYVKEHTGATQKIVQSVKI